MTVLQAPRAGHLNFPGRAPDDEALCALCGEPLQRGREEGCVRGACAARPQPDRFYAVPRLCREYGQMIVDTGVLHRFHFADQPE
jgi:hypothetical protein